MNILVVKLSSLGDVVHAMPAVQDIRRALPDAQIDWVVEPGFAPLVRQCEGVRRAIECPMRRWRKTLLSGGTRSEWNAFKADLQTTAYDAVIDLQGLTKSAVVAWSARLATGGKRYALGNKTEGSSYEAPTRWVADVAITLPAHTHAVQRSRLLSAQALGFALDNNSIQFGLSRPASKEPVAIDFDKRTRPCVALVHGTSRDDKLWPEPLWLAIGQRLMQEGYMLALPQGNPQELERSERLAYRFGHGAPVTVWPSLALDNLLDHLGGCAGVIGVDSGLSHMAVALDLPHVQIYNFDTAWRTGPLPAMKRQRSVYGKPVPTAESVWAAWKEVAA